MSFLPPFLKKTDPYYPNWIEMRRRTRVGCIGGIMLLPLTLIFLSLSDAVLRMCLGSENCWFLSAALALVLFIVLGRYLGRPSREWPCPRCGKRFYKLELQFFARWNGLVYNDYCHHCGLPEYAPNGDF